MVNEGKFLAHDTSLFLVNKIHPFLSQLSKNTLTNKFVFAKNFYIECSI